MTLSTRTKLQNGKNNQGKVSIQSIPDPRSPVFVVPMLMYGTEFTGTDNIRDSTDGESK